MGAKATDFIRSLTAKHRVVLIDGLAVIAHGLNRPTKDADVWLDPMESPEQWANALSAACAVFPSLTIHTLPGWRELARNEIAGAVEDIGMVRVHGLDCPLDVFRRPNEFSEDAFDDVISRSSKNADGTFLPDPLDLIVTKIDTGRHQDFHDSQYLETVLRERYRSLLPTASPEEAKALLDRFQDWQVCEIALKNPSEKVRADAHLRLREMAAEGDPFSQALLEGRPIPYRG